MQINLTNFKKLSVISKWGQSVEIIAEPEYGAFTVVAGSQPKVKLRGVTVVEVEELLEAASEGKSGELLNTLRKRPHKQPTTMMAEDMLRRQSKPSGEMMPGY